MSDITKYCNNCCARIPKPGLRCANEPLIPSCFIRDPVKPRHPIARRIESHLKKLYKKTTI
jgi:hypothetical protein